MQDEHEALVSGKVELHVANLEEAEEAWRRNEAGQDVRSRLRRHLEVNESTATARDRRGYASTLVNCHKKIVTSIMENPSLSQGNVNCLAAQVVLGLAPTGAAKATVLANFANAQTKLTSTTTVQSIESVAKYTHRIPDNEDLNTAVQRAADLLTAAAAEGFALQEELVVRELLGLACISPTSMANSHGSQKAGNTLRQMKHGAHSPVVRYSAEATIEAWKWSILNERKK